MEEYQIKPLESLALMVKSAQEEYKQAALERRAMQYGLVKQYLWLAAMLVSGAFTVLLQQHDISNITISFLICSILLSLIAFVVAMFCLVGTGMEKTPYDRGWSEYSELCYTHPTETIQQNMLDCFNKSISEAYNLITKRAIRLRWTCRFLITSTTFLIIAVSLCCWDIRHV